MGNLRLPDIKMSLKRLDCATIGKYSCDLRHVRAFWQLQEQARISKLFQDLTKRSQIGFAGEIKSTHLISSCNGNLSIRIWDPGMH